MFHPSTERLIDYWRERRGHYDLPWRAAVNPAEFPDLLPQVFMLGRDMAGRYPVRLTGGFVADLHGRDLKGENFLSLWAPFDRVQLQATLERARNRPQPFVVRAEVQAEGAGSVGMEVLLAPLAVTSGDPDRFIGFYQPTDMVHRLKGQPINALVIRAIEGPSHIEAPRLRLAALNGRLIA